MFRTNAFPPAAITATLLLSLAPLPASGQAVLPTGFTDQQIVTGLDQPVGLAFLPDGRLLVTERQTGWIRMIVGGGLASTDPIGVIPHVNSAQIEQGVLGIAIDPGWPSRPYVYVLFDTNTPSDALRIARYKATGSLSDPLSGSLTLDIASQYIVLDQLPDVSGFHNGGTIRFGNDGMLLVSLGEDTVPCAAQDTVSLRGVLLRLNVSGLPDMSGGPPSRDVLVAAGNPFPSHPNVNARLVWAIGLRNPFRFHVDPADGSVFVTDVGDGRYEEVNRADGPGFNFGWPWYEGTQQWTFCSGPPPAYAQAIYTFDRGGFASSAMVGAGVYRGGTCTCRFPDEYLGDYFTSDHFVGFMRRLERTGSTWAIAPPVPGQPSSDNWAQNLRSASDFLFGPDGTLWYSRLYVGSLANTGQIRRIVHAAPADVPAAVDLLDVKFGPPHPQPSKGRVFFDYHLSREAEVELDVLDLAGRRVARVVERSVQPAGSHDASWNPRANGSPMPAGLYLARLEVSGKTYVGRVVLTP